MSVSATSPRPILAHGGPSSQWQVCFILSIAGFLLVHLGLRLITSPSLYCDDSDLVLFNQAFAWGYSEQPPLYSWLFRLVSLPLGANVFSLTVFRTLLLASMCFGVYRCSFILWEDHRLARLTTLSLMLLPTFAWHLLTYLTHSLLMSVFCIYTFYFAVRVVQSNRLGDYVWLGVCAGLGMLSKYNFVIFLAALMLSGLTLSGVRKRILSFRMLLTIAISVLLVLPHVLWMWEHLLLLRASYAQKTLTHSGDLFLGILPLGFRALIVNMILLALALVVIFYLSFPTTLIRMDESERDRPYMKWVIRYFCVIALLHMVYVLGTRSERLHERWLEPYYVLLPLALFGRLVGLRIAAWRSWFFIGVVFSLAGAMIMARSCQIWLGGGHRGYNSIDYDFQPLVPVVKATSEKTRVLVTDHRGVGGNLCQQLPDLHCICLRRLDCRLPQAEKAQTFMVIWEAMPPCNLPTHLRTYVQDSLKVSVPETLSPQFLEVPSHVPGREPHRFGYVIVHRQK